MHDLLSESRVGLSNDLAAFLLNSEDELSSCNPDRISLPLHLCITLRLSREQGASLLRVGRAQRANSKRLLAACHWEHMH